MSFLKKSGAQADAEADLANGRNEEDIMDAEKQMDGKWVFPLLYLSRIVTLSR